MSNFVVFLSSGQAVVTQVSSPYSLSARYVVASFFYRAKGVQTFHCSSIFVKVGRGGLYASRARVCRGRFDEAVFQRSRSMSNSISSKTMCDFAEKSIFPVTLDGSTAYLG